MQAKIILLFCFQAFLAKIIYCQCIGNIYNDGLAWNGAPYASLAGPIGNPYAAEWAGSCAPAFAASSGGGFVVTSVSPIGVTGVRVTSENAYEGNLAVTGALPFLGAVALEGTLPTLGAGDVKYGCGNGDVGMLSEDIIGFNNFGPYGYGPAELGYGYGAPLAYEAGIVGPYGYNGFRGCGAIY